HRHRLADVLAGEVEHALAADAVAGHRDHRRAAALVVAGAPGDQLGAGGDHALVEQDRDRIAAGPLLPSVVDLGPGGDVAGADRLVGIALDHAAVFQRRGGAEDALGLGGVLHARQLDHDAVRALALDHRLGHAELVDAVAQGDDVLLHRLGGDLRDFGL